MDIAPKSAVIVSTGRTATKAIACWLAGIYPEVISVHEPWPSRLLRPLCNAYAAGRISRRHLVTILGTIYKQRQKRHGGRFYIEASPYLRACVDVLPEIYQDPMVIHLVRDPRSYVVSYINHGVFSGLKGILGRLIPYWQLKPEHIDACTHGLRWRDMSLHERICWRWDSLNGEIETRAAGLPADRYVRLRYEDITRYDSAAVGILLKALGVSAADGERLPEFDLRLNQSRVKRHPLPREWSQEMHESLEHLCGERMRRYGYSL